MAYKLDPKRYDVAIKQLQKLLSETDVIIQKQSTVIKETQEDLGKFKILVADEIHGVVGEFEILKADLATFNMVLSNYIQANNIKVGTIEGDVADFKLTTTKQLNAIDATIENLDAEYAKIDQTNIGQAWVEDLMVTGKFLANDMNAATGSFSKWLSGVNIVGDNIVGGTISTERLIIRDPDTNKGILYEINNGIVSQAELSPEEIKRLCLDGKVLVAESVTADKINVTDLFAQDITSTGNFNMGGNGALVYDYEKDELSIRVKEFFVGNSGRTIQDELDDIRNDKQVINVGARNLIRNSKHMMFDSYGFGHNDFEPFPLKAPTISIDQPKLGRPKISLMTARLDKPNIYLETVDGGQLATPKIYLSTGGTSAVLGQAVLGQMVLGQE